MTSFDDREKAFEKKFAHDAELQFKAEARRNKMLAAWAAEQLGLEGDEATSYAGQVIAADLEEAGDDDVFRKIRKDFDAKSVAVSDDELRAKIAGLLETAKTQLRDEA